MIKVLQNQTLLVSLYWLLGFTGLSSSAAPFLITEFGEGMKAEMLTIDPRDRAKASSFSESSAEVSFVLTCQNSLLTSGLNADGKGITRFQVDDNTTFLMTNISKNLLNPMTGSGSFVFLTDVDPSAVGTQVCDCQEQCVVATYVESEFSTVGVPDQQLQLIIKDMTGTTTLLTSDFPMLTNADGVAKICFERGILPENIQVSVQKI